MARAFNNNDKSITYVGIKSVTEYEDTIDIPEKGSYYKMYMTSQEHDADKCIVTMEIPELNDYPFSDDNYNHYLGCGIISATQAYNDVLAIRYFVSDSGTNTEQFPLHVTVKFKVVEFYG